VLADLGRVALERGEDALLRLVAEPAGRLDALAQTRDGRLAHALLDPRRAVHVRDQQAGRVRAAVEGGDGSGHDDAANRSATHRPTGSSPPARCQA
jgi:hypothetical protein